MALLRRKDGTFTEDMCVYTFVRIKVLTKGDGVLVYQLREKNVGALHSHSMLTNDSNVCCHVW